MTAYYPYVTAPPVSYLPPSFTYPITPNPSPSFHPLPPGYAQQMPYPGYHHSTSSTSDEEAVEMDYNDWKNYKSNPRKCPACEGDGVSETWFRFKACKMCGSSGIAPPGETPYRGEGMAGKKKKK
eukprot:NODE_6400_length_539_cov_36.203883_g6235_i0.p1 GENE.NODE_6400_length_539_cov_36.203883_g6235_i0~~NODE_6400_length_539_cov_36.203883_g6235_i0.p1  ORF type:complete len:125 (-),score=18.77 NODE_6400_length_539_cov_36.203883_g6235_i0:109-483(-)